MHQPAPCFRRSGIVDFFGKLKDSQAESMAWGVVAGRREETRRKATRKVERAKEREKEKERVNTVEAKMDGETPESRTEETPGRRTRRM